MTASRDPERLIRAYLDEGPTDLPARSYDAVRAHIDRTRQRVVIGPWREPRMSNFARIAIAAAAVIVIAVAGYSLLPGNGGPGGPPGSPTPGPTPVALTAGPLAAGTYVTHPFLPPNESIGFGFAVPDGWEAGGPPGRGPVGIGPTTGFEGPDGMSLGFLTVTSLMEDPCNWQDATAIEVGPSVDDLANALVANPGYETTAPVDVTLGGFSGTRIDVQVPAGLDLATCRDGQFWVWSVGDGQTIYAQGPEGRFHLWILDVQGRRVIVTTHDFPGTPPDDLAELQAIVDSISVEP